MQFFEQLPKQNVYIKDNLICFLHIKDSNMHKKRNNSTFKADIYPFKRPAFFKTCPFTTGDKTKHDVIDSYNYFAMIFKYSFSISRNICDHRSQCHMVMKNGTQKHQSPAVTGIMLQTQNNELLWQDYNMKVQLPSNNHFIRMFILLNISNNLICKMPDKIPKSAQYILRAQGDVLKMLFFQQPRNKKKSIYNEVKQKRSKPWVFLLQ